MPSPTSPSPARTAEVPLGTPRGPRRGRRSAVAAAAVAGLLGASTCLAGLAGLAGTAHAAPPTVTGDPLQLHLEQLTPSVVDADATGPVRLQGTITNVSTETWTGVNVAPFRSAYPITDQTGLAAAAATPITEYVGDRLTDGSSLTTVESLAPGQSAKFTVTIPRSALGTSPGVYWVGAHASGQTETVPRDEISDGRTRTFLPVTADGARPLRASLVLPVRTEVAHAPDGTLTDVDEWTAALSEGGELDELLDAASFAGSTPVSWLVDPAVLHAVAQLAAGNPGWDLSADAEQVAHLATPPGAEPAEGEEREESPEQSEEVIRTAGLAHDWLVRFTAVLSAAGADVHALPYGDVDVAAVARRAPESLAQSQARGLAVMQALGVQATPAVSPPEGVVPDSVLALLDPATVVLLEDRAVVGDDSAPVPGAGTVGGRRFVTTSAGAHEGGPGPEAAGTALAVRQRVLGEATVRQLAGDRSALVVVPPADWESAEGTRELSGLFEDRILRATSLSDVAQAGDTTLDTAALAFDRELRRGLLPRVNVDAATALRTRAGLLDQMLEQPAGLDVQAADVGWSDLSYAAREDVRVARLRTRAATGHVNDLVSKVDIEGPAVVTLSGSSGRIGATVTNELPVPVKVDVAAVSGASIEIDVPNPVRVAPRSRNRLLLQADRVQQGVSSVSLEVNTLSGTPVGATDEFLVRSSQVSGILWLVMLGGAGVLFGAIAIRFFRRGLASRREQGVV